MSPIIIGLAAWLAVNVLTVVLALRLTAARRRAFRLQAREMVEAAELHANAAAALDEPAGVGRASRSSA